MIRNFTTSLSLGAVMVTLFLSAMTPSAQAAWNVNDRTAQDLLRQIKRDTGRIDTSAGQIRDYFNEKRQTGEPLYRVIADIPLPEGQQLPRISEDFGLKQSCGAEYSMTAADLRSRMSAGFSLPENASEQQIKEHQLAVCGSIRVLANIRYNESVQLVSEVLPQIKTRYQERVLPALRNGHDRDYNNAGRNQVTLQSVQFEFDLALATHRERQQQYQQYEMMLAQYNDYLGRRVMDGGKRDVLGSLVGSSVIQLALGL